MGSFAPVLSTGFAKSSVWPSLATRILHFRFRIIAVAASTGELSFPQRARSAWYLPFDFATLLRATFSGFRFRSSTLPSTYQSTSWGMTTFAKANISHPSPLISLPAAFQYRTSPVFKSSPWSVHAASGICHSTAYPFASNSHNRIAIYRCIKKTLKETSPLAFASPCSAHNRKPRGRYWFWSIVVSLTHDQ